MRRRAAQRRRQGAPIDADDPRRGVFTRRALLLMAGQTAIGGGLAWRLYRLQIADGAKWRTLADDNRISTRLLAPPRGRIVDRFDVVLAGNTLNWRALILPEEATDLERTLDRFSTLLPLDGRERARITREVHRSRRFIPVELRGFLSWDDMARIEVNAPDLPGVVIDVGTTRLYPLADHLAHLVGYVAPPNEGDERALPILSIPGMRVGEVGDVAGDRARRRRQRADGGQRRRADDTRARPARGRAGRRDRPDD